MSRPGWFRGSSGLCLVLDRWEDWSSEGLCNYRHVLRAAILLRLFERNTHRRLLGRKGCYSQEFLEWAILWLG